MPEVELTPEVPEVSELDRVLIAFGAAGHGRLYCTCGYLMIETDHSLCKINSYT
jgi:hypothetical protein